MSHFRLLGVVSDFEASGMLDTSKQKGQSCLPLKIAAVLHVSAAPSDSAPG